MRATIAALALALSACPSSKSVPLAGSAQGAAKADAPAKESKVVSLSGKATASSKVRGR